MTEGQIVAETKRDRVRRILIEPLTEWGFRKPGNIRADRFDGFMVSLCDGLGYLSEEQLDTLRVALRTRGEGKDRRGWPRMATIAALAEAIAPRPIEEIPAIRRWFASVEGPKAAKDGALVAQFLFWEKFKRPPLTDGDRRAIRDKARDLDSGVRVRRDRERRGVASADDLRWLDWHGGIEVRAVALVSEGAAA
ncbi:hypothetical protein AL035_17830 [Salipiger aestuarii]|uniref:Uncharacterized protein n=1 Tax=Salipiger aestuarii TaxID=568098 RepID=A0A327YUP7_9RHOB|nr:hypothetical protein [Salipiger aestuarii]KAB2539667.1 hypothetical protein AL035_17830 [Salipiger aestuarii]RAK24096.1 hypothetical protein ATI53_1001203 [Salipiger aestuarii]